MLKPIPTKYKGHIFRSRLEARWATYFDAMGISWQYEPEGYDLGPAGWYLPDFYLPEYRSFIEVKPTQPSDDARRKLKALAEGMEENSYALFAVGPPNPNSTFFFGFGTSDDEWQRRGEARVYEIEKGDIFMCSYAQHKWGTFYYGTGDWALDEEDFRAFEAAASARFNVR